jgi:predicted transcriptional regulator
MKESGAATPQLLRRVNANAVLACLRTTGVATGTDLMEWTGLTRASVIAVCEDLIRRGWLAELDSPRSAGPHKGRPARRFELNARAGFVLGIDIGAATTTAAVADLRGTVVGL